MTAYSKMGCRRASATRLLIFHLAFAVISNCVNPVTPALFLELGMPDYMFGVAFAAMAGASFLFSPFWGKMCRRIGSTKVFALGILLHAVAQSFFSISVTQTGIVLWRMLAGVACSASTVSTMSYLMDVTEEEDRYRFMLYHSAIATIGCAVGYSIGGMIGTFSIMLVFRFQVTAMLVSFAAICFTLRDPERPGAPAEQPGKGKEKAGTLRVSSLIFLTAVFLSSFATTAYDNAYNYYVKAALNLPNYYNGLIRAGIGVIALVVDFTVGLWMIRKTNSRKTIIPVLILCAVTSGMVPFIKNVSFYIMGNFIFYAFNSLYVPMQQALVTDEGASGDSGTISGLFTSFLFGGKVLGALFAGFIYSMGNKLPFFMASGFFFLSAAFAVINYRQKCRKNKKTDIAVGKYNVEGRIY